MGNTESQSQENTSITSGIRPRAVSSTAAYRRRQDEVHTRRNSRRRASLDSHPIQNASISPTQQAQAGPNAAVEATETLSTWYLIRNGYTDLVNLIIRPPRANYRASDLGPTKFTFLEQSFERVDFTVTNGRNQILQCSHWCPSVESREEMELWPCVIYLHGNSSSRMESLAVLRTCLASNLTVMTFDFAGSGLSEGEYISLGYYERDDLASVMAHAREYCHVGAIALWGRSMGAVTALMHADRDPSIAAIICDSAFTNLEQLIHEIAVSGKSEGGFALPNIVVKMAMKAMKGSILKRAGFDIKELAPMRHVTDSYVPCLFIAAEGDSFIKPKHSVELHDAYAGDKSLIRVVGDHNSIRPSFLLDSAAIFLLNAMHVDKRGWEITTEERASYRGFPWKATTHAAARHKKSTKTKQAKPVDEWTCVVCTYHNQPHMIQCDMCRANYIAT